MSAQKGRAVVVSKACSLSLFPSVFLPVSKLADCHYHNLETHCDKLWLSVRLPELPGKKTKGQVLLSFTPVSLHQCKREQNLALGLLTARNYNAPHFVELQSTM
ncbi:ATP-sensitive inward rectifier potassium channel 8 [Platysternon megacephalum]|uniref:ATP-sensitive inward rectifier potassium channel 8 n=1 Tax=Platysternon megacephalum TaxID=55544 RepID=A0A4D9E7P2_9SAUR|nr:ATP-sensitive inward rectifier potassium channel 8 [Platysternon megacephalum]